MHMKRLRINKGGRPRVLREHDYGTPEAIAKRAAISPADHTKANCPLDTLLSRKIISQEAHDAADYWAALRAIVFGSAHVSASDLLQITSGGGSDAMDRSEAEAGYRLASSLMLAKSRQVFDAVENLVVHQRWPQWMFEYGISRNIQREKTLLGIAVLTGWKKDARKHP